MSTQRPLTLLQVPADVLLDISQLLSQQDARNFGLTCRHLFPLAQRRCFEALSYCGMDPSSTLESLQYIVEREDISSMVRSLYIGWTIDEDDIVDNFFMENEDYEAFETLLASILPRLLRLEVLSVPFECLRRSSFISISSSSSLVRLKSSDDLGYLETSELDLTPPCPVPGRATPIAIDQVSMIHVRAGLVEEIFSCLSLYGFEITTLRLVARDPTLSVLPRPEAFSNLRCLKLQIQARSDWTFRSWLEDFVARLPTVLYVELDISTQQADHRLEDIWLPFCASMSPAVGQSRFLSAWSRPGLVKHYKVKWTSQPAPRIVELELVLGEGLITTSAVGALVDHLPQLVRLALQSAVNGSLVQDWDGLSLLFARLLHLRQLDLVTPLGPTRTCAIFSCSPECFEDLLEVSLELGNFTLVREIGLLGGERRFNRALNELHLARLRRLAEVLPLGTHLSWRMVADESHTPWHHSLEEQLRGGIGTPEWAGTVRESTLGRRELPLTRMGYCPPFDLEEDEDEFDAYGPQQGRCYGCTKLWGDAVGMNPMDALSDFTDEELSTAFRAAKLQESRAEEADEQAREKERAMAKKLEFEHDDDDC